MDNKRDQYRKELVQENIFTINETISVDTNSSPIKFFLNKIKRIVTRKFRLVKVFGRAGDSVNSMVQESIVKRRRMIWASLIIVLLFAIVRSVVIRYTNTEILSITNMIYLVLAFLICTTLLLFVVFGSYLLTISSRHVVIFVCSSVVSLILFFELFYLRYLGHFYETVSFIFILIFMFVYIYIVMLTANIFLVSRVKEVPLLQVAQTTGYMVAVISAYFITFVYLSFNLHILLSPILFVIYVSLAYPVVATFGFSRREIAVFSVGVGWSSYLLILPFYMFPVSYRLLSLIPTVILLAVLGVLMNSWRKRLKLYSVVEYLAGISIVFYLVLRGISFF